MADPRTGFYARVLGTLLDEDVLRTDMSVLVTCGGTADRDALAAAGFANVTITNVDGAGDSGALAPFAWERQDAERLSHPDESFDVALVSAGLHHCRSPHGALLELYRVARIAAIFLESQDCALTRLGVRLGAVDAYELSAVAAHGLAAGGVANSSTPNYVYRWTEREVGKTIASYAPHARHRIRVFREFEFPDVLVDAARGPRKIALRALRPLARAATRILPGQANLLGVVIEKPQLPRDLQPWMQLRDGRLEPDAGAIAAHYRIDR